MRGFFRWSSKWWPGVIPLIVLWGLAAWMTTSSLEADLSAQAAAVLRDSVLDKTTISAAGRDITFSAEAFSGQERSNAVASVETVPGVRRVNDRTPAKLVVLHERLAGSSGTEYHHFASVTL